MKKPALFVLLFLLITSFCNAQDACAGFPKVWNSEEEALRKIEGWTFMKEESITSSGSWFISAHYYQCNEEMGYLIVKGVKETLIHQNVPIGAWDYLKKSKSKGGYYNFYLKQRYQLVMKDD